MEGSPVEVFKQEEKLRQVQLRLPENIRLIRQFNEQFQTTIPDDNLSAEDIASHIAQVIRSSSNGYINDYRTIRPRQLNHSYIRSTYENDHHLLFRHLCFFR